MDPLEALNYPIVVVPSICETPEAVIRFLVARLVAIGEIPEANADAVIAAVLHREQIGSTNIGWGAAVPTARLDSIDRPIGIVGRLDVPIDWPAANSHGYSHAGMPIGVVIMHLYPTSRTGYQPRALGRIVRLIRAIYLNPTPPDSIPPRD